MNPSLGDEKTPSNRLSYNTASSTVDSKFILFKSFVLCFATV
jgi:hypothetical protein